MKKNKILIIDLEYCFENANTMIVERITNLLRMKYDVDVATYDIGTANRLKNRDVDVIKIPYYSLRRNMNTADINVSDVMRLGLYFLKKKIKKGLFNEKDVRYFVNKIDKERLKEYDLIVSFSNPFTSHVVASLLSKRYNIPWIAYYFDPFFSNSTMNKKGLLKRKKFEEKLQNIATYLNDVGQYEDTRVLKIREQLESMLKQIPTGNYDAGRLEQELIYYIEKLDINEEKQRLANHLNYFRETMAQEGAKGKKLGFIAQEMGREINTMGSKSNQAEMQNLVVKMKDELEQIKEQVLNVL